jgi:hypothetical protein
MKSSSGSPLPSPLRRWQFTLRQLFWTVTLIAVIFGLPGGLRLLGLVTRSLMWIAWVTLGPAILFLGLLMLLQWPLLRLLTRRRD